MYECLIRDIVWLAMYCLAAALAVADFKQLGKQLTQQSTALWHNKQLPASFAHGFWAQS